MKKIQYKEYGSGNIEFLRELCDALMAFQAEKARIKPEVLGAMNFENRLVPDFEKASGKYVAAAWEGGRPVGFAFAVVEEADKEGADKKPVWAEDLEGLGFYPAGYELPRKIGIFKLLYVDPAYRGLNIGGELCRRVMAWLNGHGDVDDLWVYVANGNEKVALLYEKIGFRYSHAVWGGFIQAYTKKTVEQSAP